MRQNMVTLDSNAHKLLEETLKGNFTMANSLINKGEVKLTSSIATNVIINCCKIFINGSVNFSDEDLYKVLIICTTYIDNLSEEKSLSYIKSMYFILKHYYEKDNSQMMLQMGDIILMKFINYNNEEIKKVYHSTWLLFHNAVSKISKEIEEKDYYLQLCIMALKIYSIQYPNSVLQANLSLSYCKVARIYEKNVEVQYKYYFEFLNLLKESKIETDQFYAATLKILEFAVKCFLRQNHFSTVRKLFEDYKTYIYQIDCEKKYVKIGTIIYVSSHIINDLQDDKGTSLKGIYDDCTNALKSYYKAFTDTLLLKSVGNILGIILEDLFECYSKINANIWNLHMDEATQVSLFKLLITVAWLIEKSDIKCKFCNNCGSDTDIFRSISILRLIGLSLTISLNNGMSVLCSLSNQVLYYLKHCCVQISTLKEKGCHGWEIAWGEMWVIIYNIAVKLYRLKNQDAPRYFISLLKNSFKLEGLLPKIFQIDALTSTFKCLSDVHLELGNYKKALLFTALFILVHPNGSQTTFKQWVCIKAKEKQFELESPLQESTIICLIEDSKDEILNVCPHFDELTYDPKELLLQELKHYKRIWPSRIPMLAVFKKIYEHCDLRTTVKALVTTWNYSLSSAHPTILNFLPEIIIKFKAEIKDTPNLKIQNELYLAQLYIMQYHTAIMETRKSLQQIKNCEPQGTTANTDDKCNTNLVYTNLKLHEYIKNVTYINEALDLIDKNIVGAEKDVVEMLNDCHLYNIIANIAFEFRLYCDLLQSIRAWFICLKISRVLQNSEYTLKSISFLVENSCLDSAVANKLLSEGEVLIQKLSRLTTKEVYEVQTTFYISKSILYLRNQNYECGFENYKKAIDVFHNVEDQNEIVKAQLELLQIQYLQLPCSLNISSHKIDTLQKFTDVSKRIITYMREQGFISAYGLSVLFEINCLLIHMYRWMHLPREVRCYSRDLIVLAQQLALPMRTAIILCYLAYADVQSTRIEDCQVKLSNLSEILCLSNDDRCLPVNNDERYEKSPLSDPIDIITENFNEILLDCPISNNQQILQGSPSLIKSFKLPSIMAHSENCSCFFCLSTEYQNLLITFMHIDAEHYILMNNTMAANCCFRMGLKLYNQFCNRSESYMGKVQKLISSYPLFNVKDTLTQSYCTLSLGHAKQMVRTNYVLKAKEIFRNLKNVVSEYKHKNFYLHNEVLLEYATLLTQNTALAKENKLRVEEDLLVIENSSCLKTPKNKKSKVVFLNSYSPNPESPPKKFIRKIKCDFSLLSEKKVSKYKTNDNEKQIKVLPGNSTPCCSVNSYAELIVKTEKKRHILSEIVVSEDTIKEQNENSLVITLSPDAYTPSALKAAAGLHSQTKSLKKLKTRIVTKNNREEICKIGEVKNSVCKNLMQELCTAERKLRSKEKNDETISNKVEQTERVTRARAKYKNKVV